MKEKKRTTFAHSFSPKRHQGSVSPVTESTMASSPPPDTGLDRLSTPSQVQRGKLRKNSRWHILKRRWTRKGVVPVNKEHPRYSYLSCVREGIKQMNVRNPDVCAKDVLQPEDFQAVSRANLTFEGREFEFESYAMSVFATLRKAVGIAESSFMEAVTPNNLPYLEFISNSKSGQDFFLSNDMAFMFKSNRKRDVTFFLTILRDYLQHFIAYPHSLLVKYVGCYAIKMKGRRKKYIVAMQSIFFPAERIEERFDVKGCTAGRYQKPNKPGSNIITILKDQNFLKEELQFEDQAHWFVDQLRADSNFLKNFNCMDYSLLVGRQTKYASEKRQSTVSVLIDRIGNSISSPVKSAGDTTITDTSTQSVEDESFIDTDRSSGHHQHHHPHNNNQNNNVNFGNGVFFTSNSSHPRSESSATREIPGSIEESLDESSTSIVIPKVTPGLLFPRSLVEGVDNFKKERRRLLPKCKNALHIIDGQDYRYFVGIVDFFTRFDWRQKTAQYWKMVKYGCREHSTKHPDIYARRFVDFVTNRTR